MGGLSGSSRRIRFVARGQVQGVGFRPFVFALAEENGLTGFVRNSPRGVVIEVQGGEEGLNAFALGLERKLPPLARLTGLEREDCATFSGESAFVISRSTAGCGHSVLVSPDICTCRDCAADMDAPGNRRFRYPFTNCTNCGPRYSITRSIPYDRPATSMACFPMCPDCRAEYENPRDRRFHAQPNACPVCGPNVRLISGKGDGAGSGGLTGDAAMRALAGILADGGVAAVKGLGGFHLACDAADAQAVAALRLRKNRPHKPFAVMAASLDDARLIADIGPEEEALLTSPERPVVICPLLKQTSGEPFISPLVSPDTAGVGIMLPYTPLHRVLLEYFGASMRERASVKTASREESARSSGWSSKRPAILVMTSGNPGGEPICLGNREALDKLGGMADAFLLHDRDILVRVDDSVARPLPGRGTLFFRRARGYVPRPVQLGPAVGSPGKDDPSDAPVILGVGAELKNTLCLTKGGDAFVSQHIGDMSTLETAVFHKEIREHLTMLLQVGPQAVVRDLHPDYLSGDLAEALAREKDIPVLRLQHHFAHAHAVLAENRHNGPALALALDGTGLGGDGSLWGGEFLYVDNSGADENGPVHMRLAHLAPLPLPGGEAAIREPWRIAHALLMHLGLPPVSSKGMSPGSVPDAGFALPWLPEYEDAARFLPRMLGKGINTPWSTSCGRLFDAVSSLLGLCDATTYEGQAAVRLEEAQRGAAHEGAGKHALYPCAFSLAGDSGGKDFGIPEPLRLDTHGLFAEVHADRLRGTPVPVIARRFHASLAEGMALLAAHLAEKHNVRHVGLSGGCLQNVTLALSLASALEEKGLIPLLHKDLPPGDGCISLGQAVWGRMMMGKNASGGQRGQRPLRRDDPLWKPHRD